MSVLNTTLKPFKATAYKDGKFVDIKPDDRPRRKAASGARSK